VFRKRGADLVRARRDAAAAPAWFQRAHPRTSLRSVVFPNAIGWSGTVAIATMYAASGAATTPCSAPSRAVSRAALISMRVPKGPRGASIS
jgi:hypothetical protein